ncbi:MAG: molybdopterin converting factor subunit 1, partial [Alphaproteobacteria bacterium]
LYFAWLRSKVGVGEERVSPPPEVGTVESLVEWLCQRDPAHAAAFADRAIVRAAVNQEYVDFSAPVGPDDEVAFFPPVTGGCGPGRP